MQTTKMYALLQQIKKLYATGVAEYQIETLLKRKEGVWFAPTNLHGDEYSVFADLADHVLVARKVLPLWKDGSVRGTQVWFMYKLSLNYVV